MGITIFYSGTLDDPSEFENFQSFAKSSIEELGGIAKSIDDVFVGEQQENRNVSAKRRALLALSGVRGLVAKMHPQHDSFALLMLPNGRLISLARAMDIIQGIEAGSDWTQYPADSDCCFVKTQFGTVDAHIAVIETLRRIKSSFVSDLTVDDESNYWTSNDRDVLALQLDFVGNIINQFSTKIRQYPLNAEAAEDPAIVAQRLSRIAQEIKGDAGHFGVPVEIEVIAVEDEHDLPASLNQRVYELLDDENLEFLESSDTLCDGSEELIDSYSEGNSDSKDQELSKLPSKDEAEFEKLFRHTHDQQNWFRGEIQRMMQNDGLSFDEALKHVFARGGMPIPVFTDPENTDHASQFSAGSDKVDQPTGEASHDIHAARHGSEVDLKVMTELVNCDPHKLGIFTEQNGSDLPALYRELLAHNNHMTVTVEAFHGVPVEVEVLQSRLEDGYYIREILLRRIDTAQVVQYGIVRLRLDALSEQPRREILEGKIPLGRVLINHNVLREVELGKLWKVEMGPRLADLFDDRVGTITYARTAMISFNYRPSLELVEIVRCEDEPPA